MAIPADIASKDLYVVLGVAPDATSEEIKRTYRAAARRLHPDRNPGNQPAEEQFKAVSEAYAILSDPQARTEYDEHRSMPFVTPGPDIDLSGLLGDDPYEAFTSLFGARTAPRRGRDLHAGLTLSFLEAFHGTDVALSIEGRSITARIPAGVNDRTRIRLPGQGLPGAPGTEPGDLLLDISVNEHPVFARKGRNVTVTIPVSYSEAVLGADVTVPAPDGTTVTVRIPAGTPNGRTLRVHGRGIPRGGGQSGDLLVKVNVLVPRTLSPEQEDSVRLLADSSGLEARARLLGRATVS